ncbi:hypothetical protein QT970_01595 [Microcoleus sp. herbarium8]|uniref:hypothetical protein n=1 Tax=Microcoleus sp. herbarium8 TaxID=3055436 RepID=UPI002FD0AD05
MLARIPIAPIIFSTRCDRPFLFPMTDRLKRKSDRHYLIPSQQTRHIQQFS